MLDGVERAFVAERTLIANISLELRTPLATQRAILEQLVGNLVGNAVKHGASPGECRITLDEPDGDEGPGDSADGGPVDDPGPYRVRLTVATTGAEISPATAAGLVRPFKRGPVDPSRGHGLGLSIVAAVAEHHHGDLVVRPRAGGGLVVEVTFPRATGAGSELPRGLVENE